MEEQWINDLRKKMASHQTPVPPGLWEGIASSLSQAERKPIPLHKKIMLWSSGIGSVAAALALAFFLIDSAKKEAVLPSAALTAKIATGQNVATKAAPPSSHPLAWSAGTSSATGTPALATHRQIANSLLKSSVSSAEAKKGIPSAMTALEHDSLTGNRNEKKDKVVPQKEERPSTYRRSNASSQTANLLASAQKPRTSSWALNVYTANLPHTSHHTSGYGEFVAGTALPQDFYHTAQPPVKDLIYSNLGKAIETKKKHRLPLQFGLSARYQLSPRFSLESGITYTYLSSKLISGTDAHHFVTEQRLQYLGLPLLANYQVWNNRKWNLYVSGGGMLEKCIHGKSDTDFIINYEWVSSKQTSVMEKPLQCAVLGSLGAQFNLSSRFALYAEPGISYYFDNGSPVETIYKDQPLNFNFKLGFRIQLNP